MTKKLLLADDSVVIQKLVGLSFANENIEIVYTDNGDDAVIRAREIQPDVVLADVVMPGKSGYEVCEAIKQDPALSHVPVLLLTGTFEAFDENRAESAGADGQITKPFEAQALVSRVTDVMNQPAASVATPVVADSAAAGSNAGAFGLSAAEAASAAGPIGETLASSTLIDETDQPGATPMVQAEALDFPFDATDDVTDEAVVLSERVDSSENVAADAGSIPPVEASTPFVSAPTPPIAPRTASQTAAPAAPPVSQPMPSLPNRPEPLFSQSVDEQPPALPPNYLSPPPIAPPEVSETTVDSIAAMQRELTPTGEESLSSLDVSALDVDQALSAGMPDGDATIFVAAADLNDDPNAQTTRDWNEPSVASPLDELTQLAPNSPIDQSTAAAQPPSATPSSPFPGSQSASSDTSETGLSRRSSDYSIDSPMNETVVTNLDERLASSSLAAGIAKPVFASAVSSSSTKSRDERPLSSPFGDEPVEALDTTDSEMLDIGPISQEGDDLNYSFDASDSFDVSEQQEVTDAGDPLDQSFSSLMDVSESEILGSPLRPAPLLTDFDVSSSDLAANLPPSHSSPGVSASGSAEGRFGESIAFGDDSVESPYSSDSADSADDSAAEALSGLAGAGAAESVRRTPDLSPMMEQRIQEALEKVAWEAFSDLSESIVKQVMTRVENIAWEVIPQMAETLVREEIRQMKGEDED